MCSGIADYLYNFIGLVLNGFFLLNWITVPLFVIILYMEQLASFAFYCVSQVDSESNETLSFSIRFLSH